MPVLSPELRERAEAIKARFPKGRERSAILPLLYLVQSVEGWVTRDGLREVSGLLALTTAEGGAARCPPTACSPCTRRSAWVPATRLRSCRSTSRTTIG